MNTNYDMQERIRFNRQLREVESAPLAERREARANYIEAMQESPELVADKIGWLLDGSYGYGTYQAAQEVIHNKRMNRTAWLGQVIAALEWHCPSNFASEAWNKLTTAQQENLTALIMAEIESVLEAEAVN